MLDPRQEASEAIKDLMVSEKRSRLPLVLAILTLLALLAGGGYLYNLPPEKRPSLDELKGRLMSITGTMLNTPIMNAPTPAQSAATPGNKISTTTTSTDSNGLLSN